ncbi:Putative ribonuclease H protein At1g65750 [Linum perenne]
MNLGTSSITRAEIRGAITGLELAWDFGYMQIDLQIDSQVAVAILTASENPTIKHIYREANKVVDFLTEQGSYFPIGTHLFPLIDSNLGYFLRYDCMGISEPRLIYLNESGAWRLSSTKKKI